MASFIKFNRFVTDLGLKVHNLNTDDLKIMLTNTAPSGSTHVVKADITEISAGNGYTAGGESVGATWAQATAKGALTVASDVTWTASGGPIGPFRYVVLYNDTPTSPADPLVAYWDYGSSITIAAGENFTANFTGSTILDLE